MRETKFFDHFMTCYYNQLYGTSFECFSHQVAEFIELEPQYMLEGILTDTDYILENIEIPNEENITDFFEHPFWKEYHRVLYFNRVEYIGKAVRRFLKK